MTTIAQSQAAPTNRWTLPSLALGLLLASLGTSIVNVALPTLAAEFAAPFAHAQWVVLAYLLAITTTIVTAGRLGDALGRRRVLLGGLALFAAASLACALAPSLGALVAARAVQGVGAAVMLSLTLALAVANVPKERAGRAMGLLGTMSAIGTALGPAVGGVLTARCGWPSLFVLCALGAVIAMALAARALPGDAAEARRPQVDATGTLLLAATLGAYALAMTTGKGHFGTHSAALLALAAGLGWVFVRVESRVAAPAVRLSVLRDGIFGSGFATSVLVTAVVMATLVVGPFYLAGALALDAARVGAVMAVGPIVAAVAGVPAGHLVDRAGAHRSLQAGLLAMTSGAALLAAMPATSGVAGYVVSLVILTAGYALFQAANNTAVMSHAAPAERGAISGLLNLARNVGLVTGASAMGMVFAAAIGGDLATAAPGAVSSGMRITFAVAAAMLLAALAIARAGARRTCTPTACAACGDTTTH